MRIKKQMLTHLGVTSTRADKYLPDLNRALPNYQIDTPLRIAHFLSQVLHESAYMRWVHENLNYSAEALLKVFSKYFSPSQANAYARKPEMIGSRVYANRMGNGDEASGDGYRYRGRGLIQLTGKTNYRKFAQWIQDDVVANPDLVAEQYAVHSAVYYWSSNNLNALADMDDVKQVTKKINGGYNGLNERMAFLDKAKEFLSIDAEPIVLENVTHKVTANRLNLRSHPLVSPSTWIGSLSQGAEIMKVSDADVPGWLKVRVILNNQIVEGYLSGNYLQQIPRKAATLQAEPAPAIEFEIQPAHLPENNRNITRSRNGGRAHPLGEAGRPRRNGTYAETKIRQLIDIVNYLDSEDSEHYRYRPKGGTTYCNIYACDYCYLAGVYLPRVWWTEKALRTIKENKQHPPAQYGDTVRELNANMLHDWLEDYGSVFDWKRVLSLDVLQAAANNGEVCVIVAQRADLNRSGHIAAVVPEHNGYSATRSAVGEVLRPLESQAGRINYRFYAKPKSWWADKRFQAFSFWRHA